MNDLSQEQYAVIGRFLVRHLKNGETISPAKDGELLVASRDKVINCVLDITYPDSDILTP